MIRVVLLLLSAAPGVFSWSLSTINANQKAKSVSKASFSMAATTEARVVSSQQVEITKQTPAKTTHRMAGRVIRAVPIAAESVEMPAVKSWYDCGIRLAPATESIDDAMFLDEDAQLAKAAFPIPPAKLILQAKRYLVAGQGVEMPDLLADEFEFMGPVVGPLGKSEYLSAVGGFKLTDAFPNLDPAFHHFRIDPFTGDRVWFTSRATGTDNGKGFLGKPPTGKSFETPPQTCSLTFNTEGKVVKYTIGYVNDRALGNTGGLGGIFGPAYAIGNSLPFREAQPYKPSKRYKFFQKVGTFLQWLAARKAKE